MNLSHWLKGEFVRYFYLNELIFISKLKSKAGTKASSTQYRVALDTNFIFKQKAGFRPKTDNRETETQKGMREGEMYTV